MKFPFTCGKFGFALNRLTNSLDQAGMLKGIWGTDLLQVLVSRYVDKPSPATFNLPTKFIADIAGFARATELNTDSAERQGVCKILLQLTVERERGVQYGFYATEPDLFGN